MSNIEKIINSFGGMTAMARALGHKHPTTIQGWKVANHIPHWRYAEIEQAANSNGIDIPHLPKSSQKAG